MRRHAFDVGAQRIRCTKVATGHNADDVAESVVMNSFYYLLIVF